MPENNNQLGGGNKPTGERIDIYNGNNSKRKNQPSIVDLVTLEVLYLQSIPMDLSSGGESSFAALEIPGRNNPLYHWTGSEETLEFSISWYADHESREDVMRKCKWLKSLGKADGYTHKPHLIKLVWGDLFKQSKWLVEAAPFRIGLFNREFGLLPQYAQQDIKLKLVTDKNLTLSSIQDINY